VARTRIVRGRKVAMSARSRDQELMYCPVCKHTFKREREFCDHLFGHLDDGQQYYECNEWVIAKTITTGGITDLGQHTRVKVAVWQAGKPGSLLP
jgi:uncharacterized C2H2 Zn-finger protein